MEARDSACLGFPALQGRLGGGRVLDPAGHVEQRGRLGEAAAVQARGQGVRVQPLREERRDRRLHLFHLGLPEASGRLRAAEVRCGQRRGGGEQPVVLRVEGPVHDPGAAARLPCP